MEHTPIKTSRRSALGCMAWAGTGAIWTVVAGVPRSLLAGEAPTNEPGRSLRFAQISDSHLGFSKPPNTDTKATLQQAMDQVRQTNPALLIHTGDVSHLSHPEQFDAAAQIIGAGGIETHYVPGEHDLLDDTGTAFYQRFTKGGPRGWYSFNQQGVHFIGLNNVAELKPGGMGNLGADQLSWLQQDLAGRPASQPIVVFAHVPLWTVYADWGWGTDDAAQALTLLKRFGSVTVLNGHIHQIMQKVEGHVSFHTARSTAFPQPAPGDPAGPGPIKTVPPGKLRSLLGTTNVRQITGTRELAITDTVLA